MTARVPGLSRRKSSAVAVPVAGAGSTGGTQSVDRALQLLSLVGRGGAGGRTLADLATHGGLPRPTARRLLMALMGQRMVEQDPDSRRYHLGPEAFLLSSFATPRHGLMVHAAPGLRRLAADSGDTAFISVRQGDQVLCLHREEGAFPVRTHALQTGDRNPLGIGAAGIAILAALPEAEAEAALARVAPLILARIGEAADDTVLADIASDVAAARTNGWALNPGRVVAGSWGIARVARYPDGRIAAALSIAAVEARLAPARQQTLAAHLAHEAHRIEERLRLQAEGKEPHA